MVPDYGRMDKRGAKDDGIDGSLGNSLEKGVWRVVQDFGQRKHTPAVQRFGRYDFAREDVAKLAEGRPGRSGDPTVFPHRRPDRRMLAVSIQRGDQPRNDRD